jgi:hypothetical protein
LDQEIPLGALEAAADVAESIVRADVAALHRDLFGIIVSSLSLAEAIAIQAVLKQHGCSTEIVADDELPVLHEPFTVQRIDFGKDELLFTDMMGREQRRPLADLVFAAGGFMLETQSRSKIDSAPGIFHPRTSSGEWQPPTAMREYSMEEISAFRLDFFFIDSPNRLRASVSAESMMFFRSRPVRLRDTALLLGAMMDLQALLPPDRLGSGLLRPDTATFFPSKRSYEEEIRWKFHQLMTCG